VAKIRIKFAVSAIKVLKLQDIKDKSKNIYKQCKTFFERVCDIKLENDALMIPVKSRLIQEKEIAQEYWDDIKLPSDIDKFEIPAFFPYFLLEGLKSTQKRCFSKGISSAEVVLEQFSVPMRGLGDISSILTQISSEIAKMTE
jgi:hypothetical protein